MEQLISSLMIWISANTSYNVSNISHPEVRLLSPHEMTEEYYSGTDAPRPESGIDSRVFALYSQDDASNGVIFLLDPRLNNELTTESVGAATLALNRSAPLHTDWLENPVFQEQLLHEMIHHVQYQSGTINDFPCPAYGEKEAYLLGGLYLTRRHANDPLPNRKVLAHMYSRC